MADSHCNTLSPAHVTTRKALHLLSLGQPDILPNIQFWINHGVWPKHKTTKACMDSFSALPLAMYQLAHFLPNFHSPVCQVLINGVLTYAVIDSGATGVLLSQAMFEDLFPTVIPDAYEGLPYRQASGEPLPIMGQFMGQLSIGKLVTTECFIIMFSPKHHKECLLGWKIIKDNNLSISAKGIFQYPENLPHAPASNILNPGMVKQIKCTHSNQVTQCNDFKRTDSNCVTLDPKLNCTDSQLDQHQDCSIYPPVILEFPVYTTKSYTILPLQKAIIMCRVGGLHKRPLNELKDKFLTISSEKLQPHESLLNLNIYFQILPLHAIFKPFTLIYQNTSKQSVFLENNDHVADCIEMRQACEADFDHLLRVQPDVYFACRLLNQDGMTLKTPNESRFEFKIESEKELNIEKANIHECDPVSKTKLLTLLAQHQKLFSSHSWSVGQLDSTVDLQVKTGAIPQQEPLIPVPSRIRNQATIIVRKLLDLNLIVENNSSPWRSNLLFLIKPDKKSESEKAADPNYDPNQPIPLSRIRMVLSMKLINENLKQTWSSYPIPKIEDIFNSCYNMKVLTKLDCSQSFFQKKLSKNAQNLATFTFMGKMYSLSRLVQGCKASSEIFQQAIAKIIESESLSVDACTQRCNKVECPGINCTTPNCGVSSGGCFHYLDDIFCTSINLEEHFSLLKKVFQAFIKHGLKLNFSKCEFLCTTHTEILGYRLSLIDNSISPSRKLLTKILELPRPHGFKSCQKWVGCIQFYCHLIPDMSSHLIPFHDMLKKDAKWKWDDILEKEFQWILRQMAMQPTIYLLNVNEAIWGIVDAAMGQSLAWGLLQWSKAQDCFLPIRWQSYRLTKHQLAYSQPHVEALGLATYCSENYPLLMTHPSHLFNDAKSIQFIGRFRYSNLTIWRFHLLISSLPINIHFLPCSSPLISLIDLFTREKPPSEMKQNIKAVINKRLSKEAIEALCYFDAHKLPPMTYDQILKICDVFQELLIKCGPKQLQEKMETVAKKLTFPAFTSHSLIFHDKCFHISRDLIKNICCSFDNLHSDVFSAQETLLWGRLNNKETEHGANFDQLSAIVQEKIEYHFPQFTIAQLIIEQNKDKKLIKLLENHPQVFSRQKGVICKKTEKLHPFSHIVCFPDHLTDLFLSKTHIVNSFYHLRKNKLKGELSQFFHIRNFDKHFDKINCKFCLLNKRHDKLQMPLGLSFKITMPRCFLSFDIAVVDSSWEKGAFLLVLDVVSTFVQCFPISPSASALDVYNTLFTQYICIHGLPLGYISDNGSSMNCSLAAEVATMLNIKHFKISARNSKANKSEILNRYILSILRCISQEGHLTEKYFSLFLSYSCLLWNATYSPSLGVSPAEIQFFDKVRTHNFISFTNIIHQQTRNAFSSNMSYILRILSLIKQKHTENRLKAKDLWDKYKDKFQIGSYCFIIKDRKQQPQWKLRQLYHKNLYQVVVNKKTYCLLLPINKILPICKNDPFVRGDKTKRKLLRMHKSRLKLCNDPMAFLNLNRYQDFINTAADLLGSMHPVHYVETAPMQNIAKLPPFPRPFQRSILSQSAHGVFGSNTANFLFLLHPCLDPQHLSADLDPNSAYDVYFSTKYWVTFPSKLKDTRVRTDSPFQTGKLSASTLSSRPVTCSYKLTALFKNDKKRILQKRQKYLNDIQSNLPNQKGKSKCKKDHLTKLKPSLSPLVDIYNRQDIVPKTIHKIQKIINHSDSDSEYEELQGGPGNPLSHVSNLLNENSLSLPGSPHSLSGNSFQSFESNLSYVQKSKRRQDKSTQKTSSSEHLSDESESEINDEHETENESDHNMDGRVHNRTDAKQSKLLPVVLPHPATPTRGKGEGSLSRLRPRPSAVTNKYLKSPSAKKKNSHKIQGELLTQPIEQVTKNTQSSPSSHTKNPLPHLSDNSPPTNQRSTVRVRLRRK